jgi:hypothetical protein
VISVYDILGQAVATNVSLTGSNIYTIQIPDVSACFLVSVTVNGRTTVHKYFNR